MCSETTRVSATTNCWLKWPHASQLRRTRFWFLSDAARVDASFLKHSRKWRSLFVNEDKSNATILHAITISLTATIWTVLPEKGDHLTPHVWRNPVFPLGALCKHNVFLCSSWTQMLKKKKKQRASQRSHAQPGSHMAPDWKEPLFWRTVVENLMYMLPNNKLKAIRWSSHAVWKMQPCEPQNDTERTLFP